MAARQKPDRTGHRQGRGRQGSRRHVSGPGPFTYDDRVPTIMALQASARGGIPPPPPGRPWTDSFPQSRGGEAASAWPVRMWIACRSEAGGFHAPGHPSLDAASASVRSKNATVKCRTRSFVTLGSQTASA